MTTRTPLRGRHLALLALALVALAAADGALHLLAAQATPFGGRPTTPPPQEAGGIIGWILAKQAEFYRAMSSTIRAAKTDGSAFWTLLGISFAYGVFHAAGPGHGKAVISSYLVANEETARRGIVLSFVSAMLQALVAVLIVGIGAWLLGATARTLCSTERAIEIVSYGLIAVLGAWLVFSKGRGFLKTLPLSLSGAAPALAHAGAPAHDHRQRTAMCIIMAAMITIMATITRMRTLMVRTIPRTAIRSTSMTSIAATTTGRRRANSRGPAAGRGA